MTQAKESRSDKRQKGQFLTPQSLAQNLLEDIRFHSDDRVLEPGFGDGSFLIPIIDAFMNLHDGSISQRLESVLRQNVWGVEIDPELYEKTLARIEERFGSIPDSHNLICADFFEAQFESDALHIDPSTGSFASTPAFTYVIGNPPFGGTIARHLQDALDKSLGWRHGYKVKKETYSFFIVRSMELMAQGGLLRFICSDSFLTIPTMKGLRNALSIEGQPTVWPIEHFSDETSYPMVVLDWEKGDPAEFVNIDQRPVAVADIARTGNLSWGLTNDLVRYFRGGRIGDVMVASSGMTTGNNNLFVRRLEDGQIVEPYEFMFEEEPITLEQEVSKARLGYLPAKKIEEIKDLEAKGVTVRVLSPIERESPLRLDVPNEDYAPYNKAIRGVVYRPPSDYIYWKNDGDAVITYKKTGNWYLRGVGGAPYFGREGLTWRLVSATLDVRYLPPGFILDSGAPCAFPREGTSHDEMLFVMGWTLTNRCTQILKQVMNHTMNIQSKDFERLPYPFWVHEREREEAVNLVQTMIRDARDGKMFERSDREFGFLEEIYAFDR